MKTTDTRSFKTKNSRLLYEKKWKIASKNSGTICIWSNDATDMLIDLWLEETIQFALQNSKTSKETREVYSVIQISDTSYFIQFDNVHVLKDGEVSRLIVDRCKDKFKSQIFLVLFFHCILACIYKHGKFVYKLCCTLLLNLLISCLFTVRFTKLLRRGFRTTAHPSVI